MSGPTAKHPSARARSNKTSTRATLTKPGQASDASEDQGVDEAPRKLQLPATIEWYPDVILWWDDLWTSEARDEWITADLHLLVIAARLYQMMLDPDTKVTAAKSLASEFRQIMVQFGLTSMARRTLQWELSKPESDDSSKARKRAPAKRAAKNAVDPRSRFRVVSGGG